MDLKFNTKFYHLSVSAWIAFSRFFFSFFSLLVYSSISSCAITDVPHGLLRHLHTSCTTKEDTCDTLVCLQRYVLPIIYIYIYKPHVARGNNFIRHPDARLRVFLMFRPCWRISTDVYNRTCNRRT